MTIKDRTGVGIRKAVRECLKIFFVLPVRRRRILFESFEGGAYACNPKYISEYMQKEKPGRYEIVWAFTEQYLKSGKELPDVKVVRRRSLPYYYYHFTSGVRIANTSTQLTFLPKRRGQLVINTWHAGGAYKRIGIVSEYVQNNNDMEKWRRREQAAQFDLFLSSSPVFTETNVHEAYEYHGPVLKSGLPRNDLFFDADAVREKAEKVRRLLGISGKVVLYAPTYRGNYSHPDELPEPPYEAIFEGAAKRFRCPVTILVRTHYTYGRALPTDCGGENRMIDVTGYPDMQELLCAADLLVTDYSSSIWDYALLGRPAFLYVPDLASYQTEDRGFYTPIEEWPAMVCRDKEELKERIISTTEEEAGKKAEAHLRAFRSYERGKAREMTERVIWHFVKKGTL